MKSIGAMIKQIDGLSDSDLNIWETSFFDSVWTTSKEGKETSRLSEKQVECIEKIYNKHFGDSY
jgi:hypothetical protein